MRPQIILGDLVWSRTIGLGYTTKISWSWSRSWQLLVRCHQFAIRISYVSARDTIRHEMTRRSTKRRGSRRAPINNYRPRCIIASAKLFVERYRTRWNRNGVLAREATRRTYEASTMSERKRRCEEGGEDRRAARRKRKSGWRRGKRGGRAAAAPRCDMARDARGNGGGVREREREK